MKNNKHSNKSAKDKNNLEGCLQNKNLHKENKCMKNSSNIKKNPPKNINK